MKAIFRGNAPLAGYKISGCTIIIVSVVNYIPFQKHGIRVQSKLDCKAQKENIYLHCVSI